ncbi:uncharacterized protein LOC133293896 [Gastrolobium bilobum]|uniref:uncharacterized protein LOC133293896 n=1 Tax=Gastrolobium bilobum TaxID=150636 RepID=UPI002AB1D1C1|nr:uncharacterized protein LOC133293896 [Gastrolobium bilobum]
MINLFKKNIHSFLSFTTTDTTIGDDDDDDHYKLQLQSHYPISGLGLVTATRDVHRPPNVLESATLKPNNNPPPPPPPPPSSTSPSRIEFIDDIGGGVDGLMSCTESLGFESSDERRISDNRMDKIDDKNGDGDEKVNDDNDDEVWQRRMMRAEGRGNWRKVRSFPPPLSSLNRNGKPSFFLRPVRKDGRLELTEVRIQRPEILHASRHDGRLTLHLIPDQSILEEEEEEEIISDEEEEEEEEERVAEWRFRVGGKEGIKRCHEMVNQHHHHHHHHHHVHANHHHHHHLRMCGISIV